MKHNWEYKRLGDVCEVNFGQRIVAKDTDPGQYFVYGGGGATFTTQKYNREDCMIVSRFAMSKECVRFVKGKFFLNDSGLSVKSNYKPLSQKFLDKYLWSIQFLIYNLGRGVAQKNLNTKAFENISIPVPPMEVQERMVAELDQINDLIAKNRELLSQLDSLAQSIFYDTFGDPISNPKGWEFKKLKELVSEKLAYGSGASGKPYDNNIRYIRITDIDEFGNLKPEIASSPSEYNPKYDLKDGDILFARSGATVGKTFLYHDKIGKSIFAGYLIKASLIRSILDPRYLYYLSKTQYYLDFIKNSIRGAAQPNVNAQLYGNLPIPVPPLALQEAFAEKVEAIDAQKARVEAEIAELQTLLDARMDFWFN